MRSLFIAAVAVVALVSTACKKDGASEAAGDAERQQQEATPQAEAEAKAEAEAEANEEEREDQIEVTTAMVERYLKYQTAYLAAWKEEMKKYAEVAEKEKNTNSITGAARVLSASGSFAERLEVRQAKLLEENDLTEEQADHITAIVGEAVTARGVGKETAAGMAQMLTQLRAQLKDAPAEHRPEMEKQLQEMENAQKQMMDVSEARSRFGDASVDAVLKYEDQLFAMQKEALGLTR